uniref:Uncharacterized protein n=1 Tax=Piliocolobus tephrosceles TaxID=591936 RepID=A0A8C9HE18_9PRIM
MVISKKYRLTIIECGCDINMMIDLAKAADLVSHCSAFLECCTENSKTKKSTIWAVLLQLRSLGLSHGKLLTLISWQTGKK